MGLRAWVGIASILIGAGFAAAQDMSLAPPADMGGWDAGGPPVTSMGDGSYFSQDLGTMVRARFNTRSYGQDQRQDGNLDIGTMQVVSWDDSIAFFDGQVTLSDVQGAGFNVGIGYRWLSYLPYATDGERITGVSLWGDGTRTEASNFFPQLGVSFESLGDIWDLRANGYIPIGQDNQVGNFVPTGEIGFQDHFISELALATVDQSFYAADIELARRMGHERDVWGFAGGYELVNDQQDTTGIRAGVRGYAYPDLLLQIAVTHDDIFETNTTFSLTWFIGRTRTNFHPACGVLDRFREPVMRNDYVALSQSTALGGTPLNDADGRVIRVVHVDSSAPSGGDGTFERPLDNLDDIENNSQVRDIVFVHAESQFTGQSATLLSNQRFLGEGDGIEHLVVTEEEGTIPIPESSPGASAADRPIIMAALGDAVTIGDLNEVANFTIDGGTQGIVAGPSGSGNPNLHDLTISNTTGDAIMLRPFVRVDTNDADNDGNVMESTVAFNVTVRNVTFDNIGGDDIDMDAFTNADLDDPNVTLQETITVSDIDSTNGDMHGILLANTHEDGSFTLTNYTNTDGTTGDEEGRLQFQDIAGDITISTAEIMGGAGYAVGFFNVDLTSAVSVTGLDYDGMTGAAGAIRANVFDGSLTVSNSTLQNGTLNGVSLLNQSDGTFTFQDTVTMTNLGNLAGGIAFEIDGGGPNQFTGTVTVSNEITNDLGRSVAISDMSQAGTSVTFSGDITDTGEGIFIDSNTGGTILFLGDLDLQTMTNDAVLATNNTGADINFGGELDIETTSGNGFDVTGGGTITASNTANSITTTTGRAARITGMTVSGAGVNFADVNRSVAVATNAIQLETNTGGPILFGTVGDDPGDGGTIAGGAADAILIRNSANVTLSGLIVNTAAGQTGVSIDKTTTGIQTVNMNDLQINSGLRSVAVTGNGTGTLNMSINDTSMNNATGTIFSVNNIDTGSIAVVNSTFAGMGNAATAGVQLTDSNASYTFDANTAILGVDGIDFEVNAGTGTVNYSGDITNTVGRAVQVHNITGGSVAFAAASTIMDTGGTGIMVDQNSGGSVSVLGTNTLNTAGNQAVTLTNNDVNGTNTTMTFAGLDIETTGGAAAFVATAGGTLSVTGTNNRIDTENGTGLQLSDMNIGSVDFANVTVDGGTGPLNAILLQNLTGGQVEIGAAGGADGDGGELTSTGDAIVVTNAANVSLHNIDIVSSGANAVAITKSNTAATTVAMDNVNVTAATGDGINLNVTGSGTVNLTVNQSDFAAAIGGQALDIAANTSANDVNVTVDNLTASDNIQVVTANSAALDFRLTDSSVTGATTMNINSSGNFDLLVENSTLTTSGVTAFDLVFGTNAQDGDVIIRNNTMSAGAAKALNVTASGTNADVDFLLDNNNMSNNSAGLETVDIDISGGTTFDANVVNNTFSNPSGDEYSMTSDGATTRINLNLDNNSAGGGGFFRLITANNGGGFNFGVEDRGTADARNVGTVTFNPLITDFEDIPGPVEMPTLP
jgi:hypothetical protein